MSICGLLKFKNHLLVVLMGESLDWSPNQVHLLRNQQVERGTFLERFFFRSCSLRKRPLKARNRKPGLSEGPAHAICRHAYGSVGITRALMLAESRVCARCRGP